MIVDAAEKVVGARAHMALFARQKKRFGKDVVEVGAFETLEHAQFGTFVEELTAAWNVADGRIGTINILMKTGATLSDVHPAPQAELDELLANHTP